MLRKEANETLAAYLAGRYSFTSWATIATIFTIAPTAASGCSIMMRWPLRSAKICWLFVDN